MNTRATLSNDRTAKENVGRTVFVPAKQDNFEVVLEICKCVRSIKKATV
jgi:hypothetical protein